MQHPTYAFSLDGEIYTGNYRTRDDAVIAAVDAAQQAETSVQTVYVGRRVAADPKASGHARAVLSNMAARARGEFGESASGYLSKLTRQQIDNLDKSLELVIRGWLEHNELVPSFSKVEAISQHSVPAVPHQQRPADEREVHEIGAAGE